MSAARRAVAVVSPVVPEGLSGQTCLPDHIFAGPDALEQGVASGADWIWLLARGANPRADALERLLAACQLSDEPPASLLAGMIFDSRGGALASQLPAGDIRHPDLVNLVAQRALPIRNATFANCLVARDCFVRYGLPDARRYGPFAAMEWSARVLRAHSGNFIPSSVVVLERPVRRRYPIRTIPALVRMLGTGAWTRGESLLVAMSLMRRATP
jgi:hypothetical protein